MAREIEFRAWHRVHKKMIPHIEDACDMIPIYDYPSFGRALDDTKPNGPSEGLLIIEQFTGLRDKNGKKIFEGDIVRHHYKHTDYVVRWNEKDPRWELVGRSDSPAYYKIDSEWFEVIGNVHENPELLEAVDERKE